MGFSRKLVLLLLLAPLLAKGSPQADGTTPLHGAVHADDLAVVERLLRSGANPSASNRYGITPLFLAATNGNATIFERLLKAGADPKAILPGAQTLLMTAARTGNPKIVEMLLARGADVKVKEETNGETALMFAVAENHPEAARLLIARGAEVNDRTIKPEYETDRFGLEGVITILPHGNWTPLMIAAREGSLDAARILIEAGAEVNATDPDNTTALVFAIINGHYDTAALLLEKGADPNLADTAGMAALYAAVDMSTLGEIFGRPNRKSTDKLSALGLIEKLLQNGAKPNAQLRVPTLHRAHTPGERYLSEGTTPMMRAARNGDAAAIRLLLKYGGDPTIEQKNHTTALMLASGLGRGLNTFANEQATDAAMLEAVQVLVEQKIDVNATNDGGQTALHFAALSLDAVVELLAKHGAKLDAKDKEGRMPIDFALGKGGAGRAGGPPTYREGTAALIRRLIDARN